MSNSQASELRKNLSEPPLKIELLPISSNLVDQIWTDRPPEPSSDIFHPDDLYDEPRAPGSPAQSTSRSPTRSIAPADRVFFSGENFKSKIKKVREKLVKEGLWGMVISALDEVAWLLNLRASDIPYNPVRPFMFVLPGELTHRFSLHTSSLPHRISPCTPVLTRRKSPPTLWSTSRPMRSH